MSTALQHGVSIETPAQHQTYLRDNEHKYRRFFKDYESYELFMMLPINPDHRMAFLQKMHTEERDKLEKTDVPQQKLEGVWYGST